MSETRGEWLTRQMERRNTSVRQLADALNVATQTVYNWQSDRTVINEDRVPRLASVLGMTEVEARRGLGYWIPEEALSRPAELDRDQLREALRRFRQAADDLERLIEDPPK